MGKITTHVLDTAHGCPAAGVAVELFFCGGETALLASAVTDADGRCPAPLVDGAPLAAGEYQLVFHAGDYFAARGLTLGAPPFLDRVAVRFGVSDAAGHYHVPLLLAPHGYSTYRGS
ncbi:MAG: hydroxyisourate hydrolase [Gammaproteobacteria bacterium]|nr:hydroxyisourate hydrolase [Gammaproteobacteria bacterium]MDD9815245.1 hydroxyisourate hydrolase [Gammaproteobacteria bacterium]MDD9851080.1 hydroxyisourate hydrolase [Gammaproteobacteria bacterium]MDD9871732.1 hydroxyisourate hydrolase [Gammaproteobacteria bacterium]